MSQNYTGFLDMWPASNQGKTFRRPCRAPPRTDLHTPSYGIHIHSGGPRCLHVNHLPAPLTVLSGWESLPSTRAGLAFGRWPLGPNLSSPTQKPPLQAPRHPALSSASARGPLRYPRQPCTCDALTCLEEWRQMPQTRQALGPQGP